MATIHSSWADFPIQLTESLNDAVWLNPGKMAIPGGFLITKNDGQYLYAALDVTTDTGNDPGTGDYFWFTFDRNRNGVINPNVDVNYGMYPGITDKLTRSFYLGPAVWTGITLTTNDLRTSFEASPDNATAHRVFKMRIKLTDINVSLIPSRRPPYTRFGIKTHSGSPAQDNYSPANFINSFANLHTLYFSRKPVVNVALQGPVIGCVGLIPTTYIAANGKATTVPGYYVNAQNSAFGGLLNIIGNAPNHVALYGSGARYIKVLHSAGTGVAPSEEFITGWFNYHWDIVAADYVVETYGADSQNMYPLTDPGVDFSIHDLLFQFDSAKLDNGIHNFQVKFYNSSRVLMPVTAQVLTLKIDNTAPVVAINNIMHAGNPVMPCEFVKLTGPADGVTINFDAYDPDGNMGSWSIIAQWGEGQHADIDSGSYNTALGDWTGVTGHTSPGSGVWVPVTTCAHAFTVSASSRNTNGYGPIGYNQVSRFITIIK